MEDLIKALNIFVKYGNPRNPFHCEHDYLYVDIPFEQVSEEDIAELNKLGFHADDQYGNGGFGSFRYGSC